MGGMVKMHSTVLKTRNGGLVVRLLPNIAILTASTSSRCTMQDTWCRWISLLCLWKWSTSSCLVLWPPMIKRRHSWSDLFLAVKVTLDSYSWPLHLEEAALSSCDSAID